MNKYILREVKNPKDERLFLEMPLEIYRNDNYWVRPLDNDVKAVFNPLKNHLFDRGEAIRWIVFDENAKMVGRIAAFYNEELSKKGDCISAGCGFFESIDSTEVSSMLFDAAVSWLSKRGIQAMDGSVNFGERDMFWGVQVSGFCHPMYGANYNKPYYSKLFEDYGFQNYFTQHSFIKELDPDTLNPAVKEKAQRLRENPDFEFRSIKRSEIKGIGEKFRAVYNKAWSNFDDIVEMTPEKAKQLEDTLKPIIDPNIVIFAFYHGEPIGFFISIPDINLAIKHLNGNFNLWSKLKFMYHLKIKKSCDIMVGIVFGVVPEFQGKGIEAGMIMALGDIIKGNKKFNYRQLELVWIGDFNPLMIRMVESYVCAQKYKEFVTYRYMIDKNIEFKRAPKVSMTRKK